jgi:hypothetical protein
MQDDLPTQIQRWIDSEALRRLVAEFGGQPDVRLELDARFEWLDDFSNAWDFRSGRERNLVEKATFSAGVEQLVEAAADALGLQDTAPPGAGHYDHVLILGGLLRACLARPAYAATLLGSDDITFGQIIALGGYRPLAGDELVMARELLPESLGDGHDADEYEAMDTGMRRAFGVATPRDEQGARSDVTGASWRVRSYDTAAGTPLLVVAAPSSAPGERRANTPDTYAWLAGEGLLRAGDSVLLITTDIYNRFQHADAIRVLGIPHGVDVAVAPMRPGDVDARLAQPFPPDRYLQEIRSTIRSLRALAASLSGP